MRKIESRLRSKNSNPRILRANWSSSPPKELSHDLAHEIGESPFVNLTPAAEPLDELSTREVFETQFEQEVIGADERTLVLMLLRYRTASVSAIDLLIVARASR